MNQPGCKDTWIDVMYEILDLAPWAAMFALCLAALFLLSGGF